MLASLMTMAGPPSSLPSVAETEAGWQGLEKVKRRIEQSPELSLPLAELAKLARCSPFHLVRAFRKAYRETPHQYQLRCRIIRAKEALANSAISVTELCFAVGFESLGTFSSRFKAIVGWSPSVYRARVLAQRQQPGRFIPDCYVLKYQIPLRPSTPSNF